MRATDIVRQVLDLLDQVEGDHDLKPEVKIDVQQNDEPDDRFKSILAMLDADSFGPLANSPNEVVAPVSAVTTDAGGGVNGPKHVDDIRTAHPRQYGNN
jgi:hypothetical protein